LAESEIVNAHRLRKTFFSPRTLIVAALIATLAAPIAIGGRNVLNQALHVPAYVYAALFAAIAVYWLARTVKLQLLMHRLEVRPGFARTLAISLATDFAFISSPGGVAGYAAGIYYTRREGASLSAATTITAADQFLDLAFFSITLPLAGLSLLSSDLPRALTTLAFASSALVIALGVGIVLARRQFMRWLLGANAIVRRWPNLQRKQDLLREFLGGVGVHLRLLARGGHAYLGALAVVTATQWLARYGTLWIALALLGHVVPFALTLMLQSLILHAAMWTGVPAGGGSAELGLTATLAPWVPITSIATTLLLWRIATFHVCLLAGVAAVSRLAQRHPRTQEPPAIVHAVTQDGLA
jgi:uncharacterized protein (TIRG00374 family)